MKQNGFIGTFFLVILGLIFLSALVYDFSRFSRVSNSNTVEELRVNCEYYRMAILKNIPIKCLPFLNIK
jgi:hypothetical protein